MKYSHRTLIAATLLLAAWPRVGTAQNPIPGEIVWTTQQCVRLGAAFRESENGLLVADVTAGAPAAQAGLRRGDRVTNVNGSVASLSSLDTLVRRLSPGEVATFRVERAGGGDQVIRVVAAQGRCLPDIEEIARLRFEEVRNAPNRRIIMRIPAEGHLPFRPDLALHIGFRTIAGAEVSELNPQLAEYFSGADEGILILKVAPETPSARGGLVPGDVIVHAADQPVPDIATLRNLILRARMQSLPLLVVRKGERLELALPLDGW